jgi:hypothetical protein
LEACFSRFILNILINIDNRGLVLQVIERKSEVYIDSSTSLIKLGDSE